MITFNQTAVPAQPGSAGVDCQRLLPHERVSDAKVVLERLTLAADITLQLDATAKSIIWLQMLDGEAELTSVYRNRLSDNHSVLLPPGFSATLTAGKDGACLLYAELPDAARLDPGFPDEIPLLTVLDWTREPVLKAQNDARKRVVLVSPELCNTAAMRIQMVLYPPGSAGFDCHHEGADSVIYVLSGNGKAMGTGGSLSIKPGDLLYIPEREKHHLQAEGSGDLRFLTFYVPGKVKTVWTDPSKVSGWVSTGLDINRRETAKDAHQRRIYASRSF